MSFPSINCNWHCMPNAFWNLVMKSSPWSLVGFEPKTCRVAPFGLVQLAFKPSPFHFTSDSLAWNIVYAIPVPAQVRSTRQWKEWKSKLQETKCVHNLTHAHVIDVKKNNISRMVNCSALCCTFFIYYVRRIVMQYQNKVFYYNGLCLSCWILCHWLMRG